jgi:alkanesulfonate monooxygenase SsuD/methylene tetrahydromethanopterin reductase-like flavin-dependent oxidoreductase (luciferase family)
MASRSVLVVDDEDAAARWRAHGIVRSLPMLAAQGAAVPPGTADVELAAYLDLHVGTPEQVMATLAADPIVPRATDLVLQPHPVDPPHDVVLRSLELLAHEVAPGLGRPVPLDPIPERTPA